jgi:hypothetical protein
MVMPDPRDFREVIDILGEPAGTRTQDHLIKSQVLYQLSYGLAGAGVEARAGRVDSVEKVARDYRRIMIPFR